jgi:hypothetical protein
MENESPATQPSDPNDRQTIETGGGAHVAGNVNLDQGDFIGRDKTLHGDEVGRDKVVGTVYHVSGGQLIIQTGHEGVLTYEEPTAAPAPGKSPYKGLQFFDVRDVDLFFGRAQLTAQLVTALRHQHLLAVVGASGSGKSSLVRAGLVASLQRGSVSDTEVTMPTGCQQWPLYLLTPGARPLESLAASLTRQVESVTATSTLIDDLRRDVRSLHLYISRLLSTTAAKQLLLVVDQFEELFTLCREVSEQQAFVDALLTAALDNDRTIVGVFA